MLKVRSTLLFYSFVLLSMQNDVTADHVICKFNSLNCVTYDSEMLEFPKCQIKAVGRDDNYIKIHANIKRQLFKAVVRIALYKRANGWKPFLYDISFDGCRFLRNYKTNPVAHFFYNVVAGYVNLNHTCPYNHDLYLDKLRLTQENIPLPFPTGEYAVDTHWIVNNKKLARVNGSCISLI